MTTPKRTRMAKKSRPAKKPGGDPAGAVAQSSQPHTDEGYQNLDNQYEAAGFAISTIFKNWKKTLIIVLTIIFMIGLILLLLLPGYKCQTENRSFEKTPVELPGKKHKMSGLN